MDRQRRDAPRSPESGISHVTNAVVDTYRKRLDGTKSIILHPAAQLNSFPHLGTVFTLACTYAFAEYLREVTHSEIHVDFWSLENGPAKIVNTSMGHYYLPLYAEKKNGNKGKTTASVHEDTLKEMLFELGRLTQVQTKITSYSEFQAQPEARIQMIRLLDDKSKVADLLTPSEKNFKLRFPCPECQWTRKLGYISMNSFDNEAIRVTSSCFKHGEYDNVLSPEGGDYFDTNTPVRALIREILTMHDSESIPENTHILCDGSDWAHFGDFNAQALWRLGENHDFAPLRFFAPNIVDSTGAKLSKSVQVSTDAYADLPDYMVNGRALVDRFGVEILSSILSEVRTWFRDPRQIYRSYSLEYIYARVFRERMEA